MSSPAKPTVLRAILLGTDPTKALSLDTSRKTEIKPVTLSSQKMTTEDLVARIKKLSKLRDEIVQVMRQFNILREAGVNSMNQWDPVEEPETAQKELEEAKVEYQNVQGEIEKVQRQLEDSKRKLASLTELSQTGFGANQLSSQSQDIRMVLGRVPVKKLEHVKKAVSSQFKDRAILAVGNKKQDSAYLLAATAQDVASQVMQTLLLYDFNSIEIPQGDSLDVESAIRTEDNKSKRFLDDLEQHKGRLEDFRKKAAHSLNRRLDNVVDELMVFRGILRLGEGTQASLVCLHLTKPPSTETMDELTKKGVIDLESSS